jgi:hypothetical protein
MATHYLVDLHANPLSTAKFLDIRSPLNGESVMSGSFIVQVPEGVSVDNPTSLAELIDQKYQGILAFFTGFTRITYDDMLDASSIDTTASAGTFGNRQQIAVAPAGGVLRSVVVPLTGDPVRSGTGGISTGNDIFSVTGANFTVSPVIQVGDVLTFDSNNYTVIAVPPGGLSNNQVQVNQNVPTASGSWSITRNTSDPIQAAITWELYEMVDTNPYNDRYQRVYKELAPTTLVVEASFDGGTTFLPVSDRSVVNIPPGNRGRELVMRFTNNQASTRVRVGSWAVAY